MGLYYLQSRYYNPTLGRFLNADALVSTGQSVLGNNMFAYCRNNPVVSEDTSGTADKICLFADAIPDENPWRDHGLSGGGIDMVGLALGLTATAVVVAELTLYNEREKPGLEAYKYQQTLKFEQAYTRSEFPHVHHIVPVGNFSNRSIATQKQIQEMHSILKNYGINRYIDPMNLMLVSAKTHASLHTDAYIAHVYSYIKLAEGSKAEIYAALFYLRIEIAAMDAFALGF